MSELKEDSAPASLQNLQFAAVCALSLSAVQQQLRPGASKDNKAISRFRPSAPAVPDICFDRCLGPPDLPGLQNSLLTLPLFLSPPASVKPVS